MSAGGNLFAQQEANRKASRRLVAGFIIFIAWLGFGGDLIWYLSTRGTVDAYGGSATHIFPGVGILLTEQTLALHVRAQADGAQCFHQTQGDVKILKAPEGDGSGLIIVDDLVDTGSTLRLVRKLLPKAHYATVYAKPEGKPLVDTYITEVSQDPWILFPWDQEATLSKPVIELKGNGGG